MIPAILSLVLALQLAAQAPAQNHTSLEPFVSDPVALLWARLPDAESFVLHGTLPLPPGTFPADDGKVPLQVLDVDGSLVTTQVEVVSRYGEPADGADVVEVLARVSRPANGAAGALASYRVVRDGKVALPQPGTPSVLNLIDGPRGVPDEIAGLVADPDGVLVVVTDSLGQRFVTRPLAPGASLRVERYGPVAATVRSYGVALPESGAVGVGEHPHMLGVHAYLGTRAREPVLLMDLRFNNGPDGTDLASSDDDPLGKLYFERIDLYLPDSPEAWIGQAAYDDPYAFRAGLDPVGTVSLGGRSYRRIPVVKPLAPAGSTQPMHMMPCKAQFVRRLAISSEAEAEAALRLLAHQGLAFALDKVSMKGKRSWSWSNPATARYFPQSQVLPDLSFTNASYGGLGDLAGQQTAWYADLADALSTNGSLNPPHGQGSATQLGWARPLGSPTGGAGGGAGVQYIEGERAVASGSVDGYRYLELSHRLHLERMPNVIWDRAGFPSTQDSFLLPCPGCPVNLYPLGPSGEPSYTSVTYNMDAGFYDASFCPSPGWAQNQSVVLLGQRPDYETSPSNLHNLLSFEPHDRAHLVRFLRLPLALAWLGNDPVAKDDLRAMAEMFRFTYTEYGNLNGAGAATSLHTDASFVAVNPEWGYMTGRGDAWGLDAASAAYALSDDAFRARLRPWCSRVIDLFEAGLARAQDPNYLDPTGAPYQWGVLSAFQSSKFFGTGPSDPRGRQTWEEMLLQNAMLAMLDSVLTESEPEAARLHDVYRRSALGLVSPVCWNEAQRYIHETVPVSGATYTPPPDNVFECDPTFGSCGGVKALPVGGPFAFGRDDHYTWPALAQSFVRTQDTLFLHRLSGVLTGQPCPPGQCVTKMLSALNQTLDPTDPSDYSGISNRAALLGVLQNE